MIIYDDERIDEVNDSLSLIQKPTGLTFGTDALLLAGYINGKSKNAAELGGGSGIISMLILTRQKAETVTAYEVQKEYADLISRNAEYNSLTDRLSSVCLDIRDIRTEETFDLVFTNPPYMKTDSGARNKDDKKGFARHEHHGDISDFMLAAKRLLKYGASFYAVYRPDRLADLIFAMRASGIEPKRTTFVYASVDSEPSMLLVEGKRGGKSGMRVTKPLIVYADSEHKKYSSDMEYIMEKGSFPKSFLIK